MKRKRRILSLLLSGAMLFSLCTPTVFAETPTQDRGQTITETGGLCEHHAEHTEDCGYSPAAEGTPCGYVCELCGAGDNTLSNNAEDVKAQLDAIDEAKEKLSDEEIDELDFTRYAEAAAALGALAAPMLLANDSPNEQFSLTPGGRYYFELSAMNIPGKVNGSLPDSALHYVPFTYAGTIEAYKLTSATATTEEYAQQNKYAHSLFVADYNVTHTVSWNDLNTANLIFGKGYVAGGVDYTLRAPSVGSNYTGSDDSERSTPQSNEWDNEWDKILDKDSCYIKNWSDIYSWGQDTATTDASGHAIRGYDSARYCYWTISSRRLARYGFRPVLEVLNPDTLGSDGLKVVTLDLGGGKLGGSSDAIQIIVKNGSEFTAPASDGLTRPDGDTGSYFVWLGSNGKLYAPGVSVPADVTKLTAQFALSEQFSLKPDGTYYFDLSAMNIPGTANGNLPDSALHYVPFTYVGTINAYSRNSEGVSTDDTVKPYAHSLFVADYNVTHTVSWNNLNTASLIFGKNYASGGVDYTLRAPSVGSGSTGSGDSGPGVPQSNEWDTMLNKDNEYIQNWNKMFSWGQDTYSGGASYRAVRGYDSARYWNKLNVTFSNPIVGFRPVLEVLNPDTLGSDGLKVVTLDLGGGTLGGSSDAIQIIVKNGSEFTAPASGGLTRPDGVTGSYFVWLGSDGKLYAPGASVPADVTTLTAQFTLSEQFSLTPGGRYYFDLSGANIPGTANGSLPDSTLHYVPFTYAGTIEAYKLTSATATTEEYAQQNKYAHSLFVADYNVTHTVSWDTLNTANLIFGKNYASGGVGYTLRAPSAGSGSTGSGDSERGVPQSNEWDTILDKDNGYIQNWSTIYSWGQDTATTDASRRAFRGYRSARRWSYGHATGSRPDVGFRPVLEVLNPDTLGSDGLKVVTLDLGGGTLGGSSDAIQIIVKTGSTFTTPASDGMTRPDGDTGSYFVWLGSNGKLYAPGDSVPADVTALTVQWTAPTYTVTLNTNGGMIADGKDVTGYTYGVGATLPTDVTRTGYTFKGWYDNENLTGSPVTAISNTETGNKEYWAKWTVNQYTITYDLAGGTVEGNPDTYTIETEAFTLKNPTKSGYTFTGWSGTGLDGENNMTVTIPTGSTGNRTYTAHWRYNGSGSGGGSTGGGSSSSGGGSSSSEDRDDPSGNAFITDRPDKNNPNTPTTGQTTPVKPT
ncbi:InlB B-repeat-containing protein, partial [Acetivibrio ethanolgignens]|uniref:InlB B-repeat-containing protein n=1 Tax=Acetivibrio ethanolgignens TaxID=290052 RepID=UPI0011C9B879